MLTLEKVCLVTRVLHGTVTDGLEARMNGDSALAIDYTGIELAFSNHVWGVGDDEEEFFATDQETCAGQNTFSRVLSVAT